MRREQGSHLSTSISLRRFLQALLATFAVVGIPTLAAWALRVSGEVTSVVALIVVAIFLSVAVSYLGAAIWATRRDSGDVLFADLMLWGLTRRWLAERQLAGAVSGLSLREPEGDAAAQLGSSRRTRLLKQLAAALEARYPDTHGHSRRVARHAAAIAKRMGLPRDQVARIRTAAMVHDVGKIDIPAAIIEKPGPLTDAEFEVVKRHPEASARMVAGLDDEELTRIVRHHHERLDGGGYPDGFAGDRIPLGARIIAVADTFDAVTSKRPYRPATRHKDALALLAAEAGTQLDPEAVRAFRRYYSGHRPVALWALLLNAPRQLIASLAGQAKLAGAVTATTLATVAAGNVAITAPRADQRSFSSEGDVTRLAEYRGDGGGAGPKAGVVRSHSSPSGKGPDGGAPEPGDPGSGTEAGSIAAPSPDRSSSPSGSGGSDRGGSGDGSRGGGGSDGERDPGVRESPGQVVSDVTAPVDSTVDTVVRTIESVTPDVDVPIVGSPKDVVSRLPLPRLGGG